MANKFEELEREATAPASDAFAVTPSDSVDLAFIARSLFIGVAGTVSVITKEGTTVSFTLPAGFILPLEVSRVRATGTTATGIVALV
tara:strand:- start:186 stop:446 length:261 start_codon:yes stop_codon:yes gene_type:complete